MNIAASGAAALVLLFSCSVMPVFAMPGTEGGMPPRSTDPAERFRQMDTDHDGNITWEELSAARPNLNRNAFDTIDGDHNGFINLDEWKAFSAGHGGSVSMPDMTEMMKAMRGAGNGAAAPKNGMPLIMPPAEKAAPAGEAPKSGVTLPLINPPSEQN